MPARRGFWWFGSAVLATLILLHPGYDASEGGQHVAIGIHWLETGRIGHDSPPSTIFLEGPEGRHYRIHELGNILWTMPAAAAGLLIEDLSGVERVAGAPRLPLRHAHRHRLLEMARVGLRGAGSMWFNDMRTGSPNWQYQYQLMRAEGRMHEGMYWSADNQLTDAMRAAGMNLARMAGADVPVREVGGVSRMTLLASTGVNVWWVTALRAGFRPEVVLPAAGALALFAALAWRRALRSVRG